MKVFLEDWARLPVKAHRADAGYDLFSPVAAIVPAGGSCIIDTGVHMAIHEGYVGMIKSKSGLNVKHDLQSEGVIDSGYSGAIVVKLYNHGAKDYEIEKGDKISQIVIMPIHSEALEVVESLEETERGCGGFGSTGR